MHTINKKDAARAAASIKSFAKHHAEIQIPVNLLSVDGRVMLRATYKRDVGCQFDIGWTDESSFFVLIDLANFQEALKQEDKLLRLIVDETYLILRGEASEASVNLAKLDVSSSHIFCERWIGDVYDDFEINRKDFIEICTWVLKAASTDETRRHLNSLCLDGKSKKIVSTDGHRVHIAEAPYLPNAEMLLSKHDAELLLRYLKSLSSPYIHFGIRKEQSLHTTNDYLHVMNMGAWYYVKLSDMKFPPWKLIMQDTNQADTLIRANAEYLKKAMNTFAKRKVAPKDITDPLCKMEFNCDKLLLSNMAPYELEGTIKAECPIAIVRKSERSFGFNAKYWVDALDLDEGVVLCYFREAYDPATIETSKGIALIMPVRL